MTLPHSNLVSFQVSGLPETDFFVARFKGVTGLSQLFAFDLDLISEDPELDLEAVLHSTAILKIRGDKGEVPISGILTHIEQRQGAQGLYLYRAVLAPAFWRLTLTRHNQVFLKKNVSEIIEAALKDGGMSDQEFELRLQKDYPEWEFVCQYNETHYQFISFWMEKYGMYFFFEHTQGGHKLIITDVKLAHANTPETKNLDFSPPSGLDHAHREEVFHSFFCRRQIVPQKVKLKDYNYEKPTLQVIGEAEVKADGSGEVYSYGEHFRTPEEGNDLAALRAEELLCREQQYTGGSAIPYLRPGYLFDLRDHYRSEYNQGYLIVEVEHECDQTSLLGGQDGGKSLIDIKQTPFYGNQSRSIPQSVQFRPPLATPKSRFYGTLHALVDAAQSGQYAELDDQGRYKIILPFDQSGRKDGKASAFLRMMQPYAGSDHGMHFPLHKGTEVMLSFIDGDPNRPFIAGAVPNPDSPSVVTSDNSTMSNITTAGGNKIHMEDQDGNQRILMHSPTSQSFVRIGAPNDPDSDDDGGDDIYDVGYDHTAGIKLFSAGDMDVKVSNVTETVLGRKSETVMGMNSDTLVGLDSRMNIGSKTDTILGSHNVYRTVKEVLNGYKTTLVGIKDKIVGTATFIAGGTTKIAGKVSDVFAEKEMVVAQEIDVSGEVTDFAAEKEEIIANTNRVAAEINEILASTQKVIASETKVLADKTDVVADHTKVATSVTTVATSKTSITSTSSEIAASKAILASDVNIL